MARYNSTDHHYITIGMPFTLCILISAFIAIYIAHACGLHYHRYLLGCTMTRVVGSYVCIGILNVSGRSFIPKYLNHCHKSYFLVVCIDQELHIRISDNHEFS